MSFIKSSASAFGKLLTVFILVSAFLLALVGVVYNSLQGEEIKVPEIVGKDFVESERELAALGLKIKKRADRVSNEKINTVLEQLPKSGETVKTGQMILVVVSKENPGGKEIDTIKQGDEKEDIEKIEELISDKPKKSDKNSDNSNKKKSSKTRDVIGNTPGIDADSENTGKKSGDSADKNSNKEDKNSNREDKSGDKSGDAKGGEKKTVDGPSPKPKNTPGAVTRPRKNPPG